mmetsp:Transcript_6107/g.15177  ORF Transcript_6107/g.15177 Transcript_6107/m.15177 type:complete len:278 (+) Transcript_6107:1139-1972(+)
MPRSTAARMANRMLLPASRRAFSSDARRYCSSVSTAEPKHSVPSEGPSAWRSEVSTREEEVRAGAAPLWLAATGAKYHWPTVPATVKTLMENTSMVDHTNARPTRLRYGATHASGCQAQHATTSPCSPTHSPPVVAAPPSVRASLYTRCPFMYAARPEISSGSATSSTQPSCRPSAIAMRPGDSSSAWPAMPTRRVTSSICSRHRKNTSAARPARNSGPMAATAAPCSTSASAAARGSAICSPMAVPTSVRALWRTSARKPSPMAREPPSASAVHPT